MRLGVVVAGLVVGALGTSVALVARQSGILQVPVPAPKAYVTYVAEGQEVQAGKQSVLELRFHVVDGFHVNSHTPKSELLIPTQVALQPVVGVKEESVQYPAGTSYSFSFDPANKLDVYTGDFTVKVPVVASAGEHTIAGSLHYQACDHAACYPPKSLPLQVIFTAK